MNEFDDLMNDTITIEPFTGRDGYGTPSYGASVSYACRINGEQRQVTNVFGVDVTSKARIYLMDTPVIGALDRLTLPAGNVPQQPPIIAVDGLSDESGPHHTEITV
jgi:hypothetical protein